jgi:hypothetical protein
MDVSEYLTNGITDVILFEIGQELPELTPVEIDYKIHLRHMIASFDLQRCIHVKSYVFLFGNYR